MNDKWTLACKGCGIGREFSVTSERHMPFKKGTLILICKKCGREIRMDGKVDWDWEKPKQDVKKMIEDVQDEIGFLKRQIERMELEKKKIEHATKSRNSKMSEEKQDEEEDHIELEMIEVEKKLAKADLWHAKHPKKWTERRERNQEKLMARSHELSEKLDQLDGKKG